MSRGRARAELVVAACLLAAAGWGRDAPAADCPHPALLPGAAGGAPQVTCRGEGGELRGALPLLFGSGLDPGVAEAAALEHLPGIGPVRAASLVQARRAHPLCRPPDLLRVHGIGPRSLERLRPYLSFGADPRCPRGAPPPLPRTSPVGEGP